MSATREVIGELITSGRNTISRRSESLFKTNSTFTNPFIVDYAVEGDFAPFPVGRQGFAWSFYNDYYYIFGGRNFAGVYLNDTYRFNIISQKWSIVPNQGTIPSIRAFMTFSTNNNLLYIHGGRNSTNIQFDTFHVFDMITETWSTPTITGTRPGAVDKHMSFYNNNFFYILGGRRLNAINGNTTAIRDVWRLNLSTFTWTQLANITTAVVDAKLAKIGNNIFYFYGYQNNGNARNEIYRTTILANNNLAAFTLVTPSGATPLFRIESGISVIGNLIYFIGGRANFNATTYIDEFAIFNTSTTTWSKISPYLGAINIRSNTSLFSFNNNFYFFGGVNSTQAFNDVWIVTPSLKKLEASSITHRTVNSFKFKYHGFTISVKNIGGFVYVLFYTEIPETNLKFVSFRIRNN